MALKNNQYNQLQREYDNKQLNNKHQQNKRIKEVHKAIPEMKNLVDEMITISAQYGRLSLMDDNSRIEELKRKHIDLEARKIELLLSNGFPADYMDMSYHCDKCKDTDILTMKM